MNFIPSSFEGAPATAPEAGAGVPAQIWRRRRIFAIVFALVMLPAIAVLAIWPSSFYAEGTLIVGEQEPTGNSAAVAWIQKLGDPADLESRLVIIRSPRMMRLAVSRPGVADAIVRECLRSGVLPGFLNRGNACRRLAADPSAMLNHVGSRYSVRAIGRSRVIAIGYQSSVPDVAFIMANALLVTFLEDQRAENIEARDATAAWLLTEAARSTAAGAPPPVAEGPNAIATPRQQYLRDLYRRASDFEAERRTFVNSGRLVALAEVPSKRYFPRTVPILAAGLTLAVLLGGLAALRQDMIDRSVRRTRDLEAATKVPVLALLPRIGGTESETFPKPTDLMSAVGALPGRIVREARRTMALGRSRDFGLQPAVELASGDAAVAAAARAMHARLLFGGHGKTVRRVLITSARPGEGKTFTAVALARAAIASGQKVLVIDANLAAPAIAEAAGIENERGLAEVLRGEASLGDVVVCAFADGLDVVTAGAVAADWSLLLGGGALEKALEDTERYDLVIIDGPAAGPMPDARLLARQTDAVLWCALWGRSGRSEVIAAVEEAQKERLNVSGYAITMVDLDEQRYFERDSLALAGQAERV